MVVIKLLPDQVPQLWEAIKFASLKADTIEEKDRQLYLNRLLQSLLSSKAQCFVRLDNERQLMALTITRIMNDEVTGEKSLFINCLYSFKRVLDEQWKEEFEILKRFAEKQGCVKITTYSSNKRVFEIVSLLGFTERYRCFIMEV